MKVPVVKVPRTKVVQSVRRGSPLPADAWRRRHNALTWVLVAYLPVISLLGWTSKHSNAAVLHNLLVVCMFTALAASTKVVRQLRSLLCVLGLLVATVELIQVTDGSISSHLLMYLIVGLIGLYEEPILNAVAAAYLGVVYGIIGTFGSQYLPGTLGNGPGQWGPHLLTLWAVIALAHVLRNLAGIERERNERLAAALGLSTAARQQATELHDGVLQSLAAARYAYESGDDELTRRSLDTAVSEARRIVDRLNDTDWVDVHDRLRRPS